MTDAPPVTFKPAPPPPDPGVTADKAPRRPRSDTGQPRRRRNLETEIGAFLVQVNMVILLVPPLRGDALDATEIMALAQGINEQAKRSPRFRRMVETALSVTGAGGLPVTIGIIATRRAARHGLVPLNLPISATDLDATLGAFLQMTVAGAKVPAGVPDGDGVQPPA
jgi:hypothetical protein